VTVAVLSLFFRTPTRLRPPYVIKQPASFQFITVLKRP
jgi:hypothetical protein